MDSFKFPPKGLELGNLYSVYDSVREVKCVPSVAAESAGDVQMTPSLFRFQRTLKSLFRSAVSATGSNLKKNLMG